MNSIHRPKTKDDAKAYIAQYLFDCSEEKILKRIEIYESCFEGVRDGCTDTDVTSTAKALKNEAESLRSYYINRNKLKQGEYHQGLDGIIFKLIEWRSMFYAFQKSSIQSEPFEKHVFFSQWKAGGVYGMYSCLGKLLSNNKKDKSLYKLWNDVSIFIDAHEAIGSSTDEFEQIKTGFTDLRPGSW